MVVEKALKNQLTGTIESKFIADLQGTYTRYNNVSIQDILQYLYDNYGDLNELELEDIDKILNQPYEPSEPFSTFIKRVEDCIDIANTAGVPYSP